MTMYILEPEGLFYKMVYGQGSGADCRQHVQKLNLLRGQVEQAATGTDRESCQDAFCGGDDDDDDDDIHDERKQNLTVSQEAASMSRWNKYLEENQDGRHEEEEGGLISADHEDYCSLQASTQRSVSFRKRKHLPHRREGFCKDDTKENASKKNKIYENGNPPETTYFPCGKTEDMGCIKWPDKPTSHTLPRHGCSDTLLPTNKSDGRFKQSTCSTASFLKREPTIFCNFHHSNRYRAIQPNPISQDVLSSEEPTTMSAQKMFSPRLDTSGLDSVDQQSLLTFKTSSLPSLQNPAIHSKLFQTDEDFDDDY
ncbi:MRN complex-interacting protein isoform X2 [Dendropsophus ebraccatus]|uniref:MRN complex-interacting protein isoform X2 n=1 Tax=Dendropsophus ebraccatus TaxID=150705 RepID=UPI003831EFF8